MNNQKKTIVEQISLYIKKLKSDNISEKTITQREAHLQLFFSWIKEKNLDKISFCDVKEREIDSFKEFLLAQNVPQKSINTHLKTITLLNNFFRKEEKESDVQQIVNHYFLTKGYSLEEIKENAKKRKIIYSRYTRPAKDLLSLAGNLENAKKAIDKVAAWANSRNLDYAIETVFKKWPEINKLKPKEKKLKPFYRGDPMVFSNSKKKWYVINQQGDWLEFADEEKKIEWKEE